MGVIYEYGVISPELTVAGRLKRSLRVRVVDVSYAGKIRKGYEMDHAEGEIGG